MNKKKPKSKTVTIEFDRSTIGKLLHYIQKHLCVGHDFLPDYCSFCRVHKEELGSNHIKHDKDCLGLKLKELLK